MAGSGGPTHTAGMNITESWTIISGAATPNPPAAADDIAKIEDLVGARLPEDVRESLLLHDGLPESGTRATAPDPQSRPLGGWILSSEEMRGEWEIWKGLYDADNDEWRDKWWTPNLVSLVADGAGNSLCVDVETGALVDMDHEVGPNPAGFASWSDYLATVARNIEGRTGIGGVWA